MALVLEKYITEIKRQNKRKTALTSLNLWTQKKDRSLDQSKEIVQAKHLIVKVALGAHSNMI